MSRSSLAIVSCAALLAITACSGGDGAAQPIQKDILAAAKEQRAAGHDQAADLLEDGVVDSADYEAAIENARRCISDLGLSMSEPQLNPVDNLRYSYYANTEGAPVGTDEAVTACMDGNVASVEVYYVATHEQVMSTPLIAPVNTCMEEAGYGPFPEATSMPDFAGDPEDDDAGRRTTAFECIGSAMSEVYPEVEYYGIGY